jgi:hypothetical protein
MSTTVKGLALTADETAPSMAPIIPYFFDALI